MIEIRQDPGSARNVDRITKQINAMAISPEQREVTTDFKFAARVNRFRDAREGLTAQRTGSRQEVDAEEMYATSTEASFIIDSIAEDATSSDWRTPFDVGINGEGGEERQNLTKMIDVMLKIPPAGTLSGMDLYDRSYNIIRDAIKTGAVFYFKTIDVGRGIVISFDRIPGAKEGFTMWGPIINHPRKEMVGGWQLLNTASGQVVWEFRAWQVTAFVWNQSEINRFVGMPHFAQAVRTFKRLELAEKDLPNTRHYNAFPRILFEHDLEKSGGRTLQALINEHDNLMNVGDGDYDWGDVHTSGQGKPLNFSTSTIENIDDIKYQQGKIFTKGGKPASFLAGNDRPVNRATLDRQETRYAAGILSRAQRMYTRGMMDVIMTFYALNGVDFMKFPASLMWKPKVVLDHQLISVLGNQLQRGFISRTFYYNSLGTTLERQTQEMEQEAELAEELEPVEVEPAEEPDEAGGAGNGNGKLEPAERNL